MKVGMEQEKERERVENEMVIGKQDCYELVSQKC